MCCHNWIKFKIWNFICKWIFVLHSNLSGIIIALPLHEGILDFVMIMKLPSICQLEGFSLKRWLLRDNMIFFLRRTYCLILMRGQFFTIKATLSFIYTELKFQFWTKFYFLIIWNKHIGLSCRWGGGVLYNSQETKTDVAVLTSGCDLRPWPLLDIINTKVLSFPQSSRVDVIYSCQWKKNDTLKALKNFVNKIFYTRTDCQTNSTLSKMKWTV